MEDFMSVAEAARRFNISGRRVQLLCEQGRIANAQMISGVWLIPASAQKPGDGRKKRCADLSQTSLFEAGMAPDSSLLTFDEVCGLLSVSAATGRNWVKLGKINVKQKSGRTLLFSRGDVEKILQDIASGESNALSRRRNKKKRGGLSAYESYISCRHNIELVNRIIAEHQEALPPAVLQAALAGFALQLICQKNGIDASGNAVFDYINGKLQVGPLAALIDDLLDGKKEALKAVDWNAPIFLASARYVASEDTLGFIYISLVSIGERKASGAYYTPLPVVNGLVSHLVSTADISGKTIFDPCCGSGNFLLAIGEHTASPELIYGQDIDATAVKLARISFALKYDIDDVDFLRAHFTCSDTLSASPCDSFQIVLGNPPWGGDLSGERRALLAAKYQSVTKNRTETYDLFIERGLSLLCENGLLAFVLPEAVLNVASHSAIRSMLLNQCSFMFVQYLGNVFSGVHCPCVILGVRKTSQRTAGIHTVCPDQGGEAYTIQTDRQISAERFNFHVRDEVQDCLDAIGGLSKFHTLSGNAKFALGIVTGDNARYISDGCHAGYEPVLKGNDIKKYRFQESGNYIRFAPQSFQQVAPAELYRAPEKLLYRFICESLVFAYDDRQTLSLNSCNIVIPQIPGLCMKYILAILNARVANFYFVNMFNSVKVLRSHIEQIPIPAATANEQEYSISLVERMIGGKGNIAKVYDELDDYVMSLFGLSSANRQAVASALAGRNLFLT